MIKDNVYKILKKYIPICMIICLLSGMLTGCGALDKAREKLSVTDDVEMEEETAPEPVQYKEETAAEISNSISIGIVDFDTFNPIITKSQTVRECLEFVYEPLFDVDEKLSPKPSLAESFTATPDGKTVDITLRSNVKWHDGSSLTARDVVYTINQIKNSDTIYTEQVSNIVSCTAQGDNIVRIALNYTVPNYVSLLTFPIIKNQTPMGVEAEYKPMGTGAFVYDGVVSSGKMEFRANEQYFKGRPLIDTLYVYTIPDVERYESMFEASETDIITDGIVDLSEYTPRGSARNYEYITNKMTYVGFNLKSTILRSPNTRRGLAELIDKEGIVNSTIYSRGVAVDIPINPSSVYYYDTNEKFKRDEALALSLFGNDGWGVNEEGVYTRVAEGIRERLEVNILTDSDSEEKTAIAEKIAADYIEFGIPTVVNSLPNEQYNTRLDTRDFDLVIGEIELSPNMELTPLVSSERNYFSYRNTDIDTIVGQMGITHDEEQLMELFKSYSDIIVNDMPFTPVFFRKGDVFSSVKLKTAVVPSVTRMFHNIEGWSVKE